MTNLEHNDAVAKLIQKNLKRDLPSVVIVRQGYKGTGSKSYKRQIFLRTAADMCLDVWLDAGRVQLGGIHRTTNSGSSTAFRVGDRTPEETYSELLTQLRQQGF